MNNWFYILKIEWKSASLTGVFIIFSIIFESFGFGLIFPMMQGMMGQDNSGFFYDTIALLLGFIGLDPSLEAIIIILCVMVFLKTIFTVMRELMKSFLGFNFKQKIISKINRQLFNKTYSDIIKEQHGVWFNRIVVETQSTSMGLIQFIEVIISLIYIVMLSAVLFLTEPSLTLKAIGLAGIFFIGIYLLMNNYAKRTGIKEVALNQYLNAQISENISLNKEYRIAQTTDIADSRVNKAAIQLRNVLVAWDTISSSVAPFIELFLVIGFCSLILITSSQSQDTLGELVSMMAVFAVVGLRMLQRCARLSSSIMSVRKYSASLQTILPFIKIEEMPNPDSYTFPGGDITCRSLTIHDRDGNPVLNEIDLDITECSITAILGPSGSGKTSLIETLLGLRRGHDGHAYYNGVNINDIYPPSILQNVSVVSQNVDLFNTSLKENISGKLDLSADDISELGKLLRLNSFVDKLDDGYNTVVGERGNMLSGGQKQRVLIARALKYDAPYLILDEPTSAMDAELEEHIFELIKLLKGKKTIIIITHRTKLLELADSVYEIIDQKLIKKV